MSQTETAPETPDPIAAFLDWLIAMDDPDSAEGMEARRTVTLTRIIENARGVKLWRELNESTTAGEDHECAPPPVAEYIGRGSAAERRWNCPEDGTRFILVKRMVGRQMRAEWRKMPASEF